MKTLVKGTFSSTELPCPICGVSLLPPTPNICEHLVFYLVHGPVDDPFFEYLHQDFSILPDDVLETGGQKRVAEKHNLAVYVLDEEDADYPTQIVLGIRQDPH
jgi:hypothetical protein